MYLIGIDIGTTNTKVALYKTNGELLHTHSEPTISHKDGPGTLHYVPGQIWQAACKGLRDVLTKTDSPSQVRSVRKSSPVMRRRRQMWQVSRKLSSPTSKEKLFMTGCLEKFT